MKNSYESKVLTFVKIKQLCRNVIREWLQLQRNIAGMLAWSLCSSYIGPLLSAPLHMYVYIVQRLNAVLGQYQKKYLPLSAVDEQVNVEGVWLEGEKNNGHADGTGRVEQFLCIKWFSIVHCDQKTGIMRCFCTIYD